MPLLPTRWRAVWRRSVSLGWPIAVQQTFSTLMRTVDIVVTGLFSPAAVAALGLADLYMQIPLRVGLGLGTGAITLSSQDTGRAAGLSRDRAVSQALLMGAVAGLPLAIVGLFISQLLIAVLGAEAAVVRLGGQYLAIVFAAAPMRIVGIVGGRSLQGAGDTRTPMLVNGAGNLINIALTVSLGLGVWIAPPLGIVGVGVGTAVARTFEAATFVGLLASDRTVLSLVRPREPTITRQLVAVSLPNFAEGMSTSIANFPFNALLLVFGTEPVAAYHIGRRVYQQFTGPLYRTFGTIANIVVGQTLGASDAADAREAARAILGLGLLTLTGAGVFLVLGAGWLVPVFTGDPRTLGYAIDFTRVFGVSMVFLGVFFPLAGALRGAGDTRTPFYARFVGAFGVMLGGSYVLAFTLGFGLLGVYAALVLTHVTWAVIAGAGFLRGDWADTAATMMAERAAVEEGRP